MINLLFPEVSEIAYSKGECDMSETITQTKSEQKAAEASAIKQRDDLLDQLLKPEVQESLTALVDQLPKLVELVGAMTQAYDIAQTVANDKVLINDTKGAIKEIVEPLVDEVKVIAATAIEAKDRAEESTEVIGLFGLLRMLKDPQAQKLFRFVNAYLEVAGEHDSRK